MPTINKPNKKQKNQTVNERIRKEVYATSKWRKLRVAKLIEQPLCEICLQNGKVTAGIDVHHIISFVSILDPLKRKEVAYDYNNLQTLCKECHQKIHNQY